VSLALLGGSAPLVELHLVLGFALIALLVAILLVGLSAALRRPRPPRLYFPLHTIAAGLLVVEVLIGLVLLATGRRPRDTLHLLYGVAALATMPIARSMISTNPERAKWYHLGASVFLFGLLVRLATTG